MEQRSRWRIGPTGLIELIIAAANFYTLSCLSDAIKLASQTVAIRVGPTTQIPGGESLPHPIQSPDVHLKISIFYMFQWLTKLQ